jgi:hypothetical protein
MIEDIKWFVFHCSPMNREFPIRSMEVSIYATSREEADEIFHNFAHKFFDENINLSVKVVREGYRQI